MNFEDISIGTDIEKIERFEKYASDKNAPLVRRIFTEGEIEYCYSFKNPAQHLAVRFCAKEAVYKALSVLGIDGVDYCDIEVVRNFDGVPSIKLLKEKNVDFRLSLSHGSGSAVASVIAIKK